jgi:hypothetical protein
LIEDDDSDPNIHDVESRRSDSEAEDEFSDSDAKTDDDEEEQLPTSAPTGGRRGNDLLKYEALMTPFVDIANALALPCNSNCCLNRSCTQDLSIRLVLQERTYIYGSVDEPAPKDSEKSKIIKKALNEKFVKDSNGKHHFLINGNCRLCPAAYVRVAGLSKFQDFSKAPGQFLRLFNKHVQGDNKFDDLSDKKIRLKADDKYTPIRGFQEGFISDIALYFSDTLPTVKNPKGSTETKQLPYKFKKDLYEEMKFQCQTSSPPSQNQSTGVSVHSKKLSTRCIGKEWFN